MSTNDAPKGWATETLSRFIDLANKNTLGTFVHYHDWFARLQEIDAIFSRFSENMLNIPAFYELFLFVRSHSSYRAAVRLATSGQVPEALSLLRGSLEYALYSFHLNKFPEDIDVWAKRDESESGKKKARNKLTFQKMLRELHTANVVTGKAARHFYELTIDAGAHPNRKTITLSMKRQDTKELISIEQAQLNNDPDAITFSLKTCAQVGICSLKIFKIVFPERFDLLGLSDLIEKATRRVGPIPL